MFQGTAKVVALSVAAVGPFLRRARTGLARRYTLHASCTTHRTARDPEFKRVEQVVPVFVLLPAGTPGVHLFYVCGRVSGANPRLMVFSVTTRGSMNCSR